VLKANQGGIKWTFEMVPMTHPDPSQGPKANVFLLLL